MRPTRRLLTVVAIALGLALGASGMAGAAVTRADMVMGRANAPVTVIEYASVTCPHCAAWHRDVWPTFKARYVDTGKVRFVFRELPTEPAVVSTGGFLVARCAGAANYFKVIDALFKGQARLFGTSDFSGWLTTAGAAGGLSSERSLACAQDQKGIDALNARIAANLREHEVRGTPTFFVNGKRTEGELAALDAAIQPLLRGR